MYPNVSELKLENVMASASNLEQSVDMLSEATKEPSCGFERYPIIH